MIPSIELLQQESIPASCPGIYFLFEEETLQYIGKSWNTNLRVGEHLQAKKIQFNRFSVIPCEEDKLSSLENYLIQEFKPPYNQSRC